MRRSREEWQKLKEEQKESGEIIAGFCEEKGIHPDLFHHFVPDAKARQVCASLH